MAGFGRYWITGTSLACVLISASRSPCRAQDMAQDILPPAPATAAAASSSTPLPDAPLPNSPGLDSPGIDSPQPQNPQSQAQQAPPHQQPPQTKPPGPPLPAGPCEVRNAAASLTATAAVRASAVAESDTAALAAPPRIVGITLCVPHLPMINWYARFLNGPQVKALTPLQKAHLAGRNLVDPFNLLTIAGEGAIAVGFNAHGADGPGMRGYANYVGVSFTQDMVAEFFGTFAIPSLVHQDPHYHRMPGATIKRRAFHCIAQVVWTLGDNGKPMPNYANLVGSAATESINNLYVPGQRTNLAATASRYGLDLATAPIDNFVIEFLPDIARHIRVRVVLVQRIINQVARTDGAGSTE